MPAQLLELCTLTRKTVGLNLLKIACEVNIKKKVFKSIFDNFFGMFGIIKLFLLAGTMLRLLID